MYGIQQAILSKRPVEAKAWGKRKIRKETLRMLRDERDRVVRSTRQQMILSIGDIQRPVTTQEKVTLLMTSILSQPLCKLGGMLFRYNRSIR